MESSLTDSILNICGRLNKSLVEYIIVGGTAVGLHGYYKHFMNVAGEVAEKPDLDFWYNPTYNNYFRLFNALEELRQALPSLRMSKRLILKKSFLGLNSKSIHSTFCLS